MSIKSVTRVNMGEKRVVELEAEAIETQIPLESAEIDYNKLTKTDLCKILAENNIEFSKSSNKSVLIDLIEGAK